MGVSPRSTWAKEPDGLETRDERITRPAPDLSGPDPVSSGDYASLVAECERAWSDGRVAASSGETSEIRDRVVAALDGSGWAAWATV